MAQSDQGCLGISDAFGPLGGPSFYIRALGGPACAPCSPIMKRLCALRVPVVSWGRVSLGTWKDVPMSFVPFRPTRSHAVGLYWALIGFFHPFLDCFLRLPAHVSPSTPSLCLHPDLPPCNTQDISASNDFFLSLLNYKLYGDRGCESDVLNFHCTHHSVGVPCTSEE